MKTVILANGAYPEHTVPRDILHKAEFIVCCDGAVEKLVNDGLVPGVIVGDLDSISPSLKVRFSEIISADADQETNDLTKAVKWCVEKGIEEVYIVGATGLREDHTLGNISLLAEYCRHLRVKMYTDTGVFEALDKPETIDSYPGQQISIFSIDPATGITSSGLRYPLNNLRLTNWWCGTLNEALGTSFSLDFDNGRVIVFREY